VIGGGASGSLWRDILAGYTTVPSWLREPARGNLLWRAIAQASSWHIRRLWGGQVHLKIAYEHLPEAGSSAAYSRLFGLYQRLVSLIEGLLRRAGSHRNGSDRCLSLSFAASPAQSGSPPSSACSRMRRPPTAPPAGRGPVEADVALRHNSFREDMLEDISDPDKSR